MAQRPGEDEETLHRWFWGKTGIGALIRAVAARMAGSDDPRIRALVKGLVR